jgi:hypothetical protein
MQEQNTQPRKPGIFSSVSGTTTAVVGVVALLAAALPASGVLRMLARSVAEKVLQK